MDVNVPVDWRTWLVPSNVRFLFPQSDWLKCGFQQSDWLVDM